VSFIVERFLKDISLPIANYSQEEWIDVAGNNTRYDMILQSESSIMSDPNYEIIKSSGVESLLQRIRPEWKAKNLVQRTINILPVDPSSACQRIFNASIHDLREKVLIAGIDIAQAAAKAYKLPVIISEEDITERYDTTKIINLAYRMGLVSRPEFRKIMRVYDIRKDLEHEDDEYEAGVADVVYVFSTCIDIILANDPVHILKISDIKELIEEPTPSALDNAVIDDYEGAPIPRQLEIYQMLIGITLKDEEPDIVRQNSFNAIGIIMEHTKREVLLEVSREFNEKRLNRRSPNLKEMRVASIAGILPYLRGAYKKDYFGNFADYLEQNSHHWSNNNAHGEMLRNLTDVGGLTHVPEEIKLRILEWLILCYIGEPGGYGPYGANRKIFYSNSGAPISMELLESDDSLTKEIIESVLSNCGEIKRLSKDKYVKRRLDEILDIFK